MSALNYAVRDARWPENKLTSHLIFAEDMTLNKLVTLSVLFISLSLFLYC